MSTVPASLRRYRADLVAAIDRELEGTRGIRPRRTLARPWHSRWGALLVATAIVAVVLLVLTVATPWQSSRTILDRAEAALLAPSAGNILYERVTVHPIVFSPRGTVARVQLWVDSAPPRRFRMTFGGAWRVELGGTLGTSKGLNYVASDRALRRAAFPFRVSQSDLDPAAFIRAALKSGRAKLDGRATIRGRDVIRIQLSSWFNSGYAGARLLEPIALYYVDLHTYRPVRLVIPPPHGRVRIFVEPDAANPRLDYDHPEYFGVLSENSSLGFPMDPSVFLLGFPGYPTPPLLVLPAPGAKLARIHRTYDFEDYRLLRPTAANRALTNVIAVHPRADVP